MHPLSMNVMCIRKDACLPLSGCLPHIHDVVSIAQARSLFPRRAKRRQRHRAGKQAASRSMPGKHRTTMYAEITPLILLAGREVGVVLTSAPNITRQLLRIPKSAPSGESGNHLASSGLTIRTIVIFCMDRQERTKESVETS